MKVLIRTKMAGVWMAEAEGEDLEQVGRRIKEAGDSGVFQNARMLWRWSGAFTQSELAEIGTRSPEGCRFPPPVGEVWLSEIVQVLPMSQRAWDSLQGVPNHDISR